jgi:two-component system, OmpR family, sensor kinase
VLSVSDQGPGLPLAMRTRLFERYASGRGDGGNGLGLALVARVARLHGARVAVQTQAGQGTTVSLSMKLVQIGFAAGAA